MDRLDGRESDSFKETLWLKRRKRLNQRDRIIPFRSLQALTASEGDATAAEELPKLSGSSEERSHLDSAERLKAICLNA